MFVVSALQADAPPTVASSKPPARNKLGSNRAPEPRTKSAAAAKPNILVIVLDDIGMDQMSFPPFNWNAAPESPSLPVLAEIAAHGVSFRNFWATPECSPSRASMLTGRQSLRTGVVTAIVDPMLPITQLHPSEVTVPKLLAGAGYISGMLGKYHMGGGSENTPPGYGYEAPSATLGVDFYDGYWDLPPSVDSTIGGQTAIGTYDCGGIGGFTVRGAACFPNGMCVENVNPYQAMAMGATPLLKADGTLAATCAEGVCSGINFEALNAYYVWSRTITTANLALRPELPQREYLTSFISRRTAEWIENARESGQPWIAFSMHSSAHTPIQTPPPSLTGPAVTNVSCALSGVGFRQQFKLMAQSLDKSIGNMLVDLGLGSRVNGVFELGDLQAANTMLLIVNDNGTYGYDVLPPFDPQRSKQTVFESGVRSACIIAGVGVQGPARAVDEIVSITDLFGLLCETAGVDWTKVETPSRRIDCKPMMPYLTNPNQGAIREFDFAMYKQGSFAEGAVGPCIMQGSVVDGLITSDSLCVANGGCWAGGSVVAPYPNTNYCDIASTDPKNAIYPCGGTNYCMLPPELQDQCPAGSTWAAPPSLVQYAVRHGHWKLIVQQLPTCLAPEDCGIRLYKLKTPVAPYVPGIEGEEGDEGVWNPLIDDMPTVARLEYELLKAELIRMILSEPTSLSDGNLDGVVDGADIAGVLNEWGSMGFWDATQDGVVDGNDLACVLNAWGDNPFPIANVPECLLISEVTLVHEYQLDGNYNDSVGTDVVAQPLGGTLVDGGYVFGANQGLVVAVDGLDLSDFAIEFEMKVNATQFAFSKLLDFFNRTEDRGFYRGPTGAVFQILPPFGPMSATTLPLGVTTTVRLARDSGTRLLSASVNGVVQWVMPDPLGLAIPPSDGNITFFADDSVTNYVETCSGSVNWIRISSNTAK